MRIAVLIIALGLAALPAVAQSPRVVVSGAATASALLPQAGWLRVPDVWLIYRFVQSNVGPASRYRVAFVIEPGRAQPVLLRSSGRPDVDRLAFEYGRELAARDRSARGTPQTFQLELVPPQLEASEKSESGRKPVPAGEKFHAPAPDRLYQIKTNVDLGGLVGRARYQVVFPAGGGYAKEALVLRSGGSQPADLFYLRNCVLNWQTSLRSTRPLIGAFDVFSIRQGFGGRFTNEETPDSRGVFAKNFDVRRQPGSIQTTTQRCGPIELIE